MRRVQAWRQRPDRVDARLNATGPIVVLDGLDRPLPATPRAGAPGVVALGLEDLAAGLEQVGGGPGGGPEADAQAGQERGAQGGRLDLRAATQGEPEQVGLELQEGVG